MTEPGAARNVFDAVGGAVAVGAVVDELYVRVRSDPALADFFVDVDMAMLKAHQRAFIAAALGGPETYSGQDMAAAHRNLTISAADFDAVVGHVLDTLAGFGVATDVLMGVTDRLEPLRAGIITVPPAPPA